MVSSSRFTPQLQQEQISRQQLSERLLEFGWTLATPLDLGEDFIIHIYFQGRATGITFHLQEKSVTNLSARRQGEALVYDLKIKDLLHWETFSQPVVLVVWDVERREGRWALIADLIADLDQRRPAWRDNKSTVRVRIPWNNTTDDEGLAQLRRRIGQYFYPLLAKDRPLEMKFKLRYPNTTEGQAALASARLTLKIGEETTIEGKFISEVNYPEWWTPWADEPDLTKIGLTISTVVPVFIHFTSDEGEEASLQTEFRLVRANSTRITLSNDHQIVPLHFKVNLPKSTQHAKDILSIRVNHLGDHVCETQEILRFVQALTTGGKLQLDFLTAEQLTIDITILPKPEKSLEPAYLHLINQLCLIQSKTGCRLNLPPSGLINTDLAAIQELTQIIERGKTVAKRREASGEFRGPALEKIMEIHQQGDPIHLTITVDESWVDLLGQKIQTGPLTRHIRGTLAIPAADLAKAIAGLAPDEYITLSFADCEIIEIFPDWFRREAQRVSALLFERFAVEAVYLFGSLAWKKTYTPDTDIDLAVKGLSAEQYLEAVGYLDQVSHFPIDLVDLNKVPDHLRQRIIKRGKRLGG